MNLPSARYCYLRQEVDGTYILELHKDEKQCEAKATIVMDFCTEVVQVIIDALSQNEIVNNVHLFFRTQNVVDIVLNYE